VVGGNYFKGIVLMEWMYARRGVKKKNRTAIIRSALTELDSHAREVIAHLPEARCEDAERMVALEAEQQDDNLLAARAVGGEVAVLVANLRRGLLEDDAVHGRVAEEACGDEALIKEADGQDRHRRAERVSRRQQQKEDALAARAHQEPRRDGEVGAEELKGGKSRWVRYILGWVGKGRKGK
jgi:hypothetical protein